MSGIINTALVSNPANWVTVALFLVFAAILISISTGEFGK